MEEEKKKTPLNAKIIYLSVQLAASEYKYNNK